MVRSTITIAGRAARMPALAGPLGRLRDRAAALGTERLLLLALLAVGLIAHALNMFQFPSFTYKDDEGIYASQAWSVLRELRLSPYTYFYDHAPVGWIMIAGWMGLTGGPFSFGGAIDSGRLLMLLLHLAMIPLLYRAARRLGAGMWAAALAVLLFSLSPLAIFYQRMLLLDNIMLFWTLLSLDLLLDGHGRLSRAVLSGICFGLALLTKETAVFLLPALLLVVFQQRWAHQGYFSLGGWLLPMLMVVTWYPLFAALKGELLPVGQSLRFFIFDISAPSAHVSLVDALKWQATRGGGGMFNLNNLFWQLVRGDWMVRDPLLLAGGALASGLNLLRGLRNRRALVAGLLGALPLLYLARGGVVFDYYILFAIPFLCLNLALLVAPLLGRLPARAGGPIVLGAAALLAAGYLALGQLQPLYTQHPSQAGREATAWIKRNVPADSLIISRDDMWTDLREPGLGGPGFPNIHSHWKVAADPAVHGGVFHDDWRTVDYLIMSPGLRDAFVGTNDQLALDALSHAHPVKRWTSDGAEVELWKVDEPGATEDGLLAASAASIAAHFEQAGAYPGADGTVTSEAQSYALLRAVWSNDRASFARAWGWTQAHLANGDGLLAWQWRGGKVIDAHTAADADTDTALALLMAGRRWNDAALLDAGRRMVRQIWQREVVVVNGRPYLAAGDWAPRGAVVALNPSYFAPYAYRIFQEVDHEHDWLALIDSSYQTLFDAAKPLGAGTSAGLAPDWVGLDRGSGALVPLALAGRATTDYGYDAARTYWRVALDQRWSGDGRADAFLRQAGFLRDEVRRKGTVSAVYAHDGTIVQAQPSIVGNAGALAALLTLDPAAAHGLYAAHFVGAASRDSAGIAWDDARDLYAQEWGWFATGLYAGALPDLWHAH